MRNTGNVTGSNSGMAIEVNGLTKTYRGNIRALNGLTFSVPSGSIYALLGPNGAVCASSIDVSFRCPHAATTDTGMDSGHCPFQPGQLGRAGRTRSIERKH